MKKVSNRTWRKRIEREARMLQRPTLSPSFYGGYTPPSDRLKQEMERFDKQIAGFNALLLAALPNKPRKRK